VYGWYSDNSVFLEDPGVYLRPGVLSSTKVLSSRNRGSSRTNFQVLVLVLVLEACFVLVFVLKSQVLDNNTGIAYDITQPSSDVVDDISAMATNS